MNPFPITLTPPPPGVIDLGLGLPDLSLLPLELLQESATAFFANSDQRPLQYGFQQGDGYFRRALADFLAQVYGSAVDPNRLFITAGASSGLDMLCTLYTQPGDTILVEQQTYYLARRIFQDHGLKLVPVPMDQDGLSLQGLTEILPQCQPKFLYTIPTFQNPSGVTLSAARRQELVELARQYHFLVIADEVYHFLPFGGIPPAPLATFAETTEQVISLNSFSKILAPGLRLGWIQAHQTVISRLSDCGLLESGGGMNPFTSALVRPLVESGELAHNIVHLQREYAQRAAVMDAALRQHLPTAQYHPAQGGFFYWLQLPGVNTSQLRLKAREFQVDLRPGALFSSQPAQQAYLRLCFAYYGCEEIEEGVRRLGLCLE